MPSNRSKDSALWNAQQFRLTIFPISLDRNAAETWWKVVLGADPETRTTKVREAGFQDEGLFNESPLVLAVAPNRIDWVWSISSNVAVAGIVPSLGKLPETITVFQEEVLNKMWPLSPPAKRLAFGAINFQTAGSKEDSYARLAEYLPSVTLDPKNSQDFHYQINRPRMSKVLPNMTLNRLSKWAAMRGHFAEVQDKGVVLTKSQAACQLELDVNTDAAKSEPLPTGKLKDLFNELVTLALEIAAEGDVK